MPQAVWLSRLFFFAALVKAAEKAEIRRVGHGDGWQSVNRDAQRGWDSQNSQRNQERNPDQGTQ